MYVQIWPYVTWEVAYKKNHCKSSKSIANCKTRLNVLSHYDCQMRWAFIDVCTVYFEDVSGPSLSACVCLVAADRTNAFLSRVLHGLTLLGERSLLSALWSRTLLRFFLSRYLLKLTSSEPHLIHRSACWRVCTQLHGRLTRRVYWLSGKWNAILDHNGRTFWGFWVHSLKKKTFFPMTYMSLKLLV